MAIRFVTFLFLLLILSGTSWQQARAETYILGEEGPVHAAFCTTREAADTLKRLAETEGAVASAHTYYTEYMPKHICARDAKAAVLARYAGDVFNDLAGNPWQIVEARRQDFSSPVYYLIPLSINKLFESRNAYEMSQMLFVGYPPLAGGYTSCPQEAVFELLERVSQATTADEWKVLVLDYKNSMCGTVVSLPELSPAFTVAEQMGDTAVDFMSVSWRGVRFAASDGTDFFVFVGGIPVLTKEERDTLLLRAPD